MAKINFKLFEQSKYRNAMTFLNGLAEIDKLNAIKQKDGESKEEFAERKHIQTTKCEKIVFSYMTQLAVLNDLLKYSKQPEVVITISDLKISVPATENAVSISWKAAKEPKEPAIKNTDFEYYITDGNIKAEPITVTPESGTDFVAACSGLTPSTKYEFFVRPVGGEWMSIEVNTAASPKTKVEDKDKGTQGVQEVQETQEGNV